MSLSEAPVLSETTLRLSKREIEVLRLVVEGQSNQQVGEALFLSKRAVELHLASIYDKLHVTHRLQAFRRATQLGIICPVVTAPGGYPL